MARTPESEPETGADIELVVNNHPVIAVDGDVADLYYKCTECFAVATTLEEMDDRDPCGEIERLEELKERHM